jgi:4-aminobutyrate aminotransferase-like enzyme
LTRELLSQTRERVFGGTYRTFYSSPLVVDSASGCRITDADGVEYLDAYNNVPAIGHSSPEVAEAVNRQLLRANTHTRYIDQPVLDYADRLIAAFPDSLESVVFACSGSEANDLALRIVAHATGRDGVIVTRHAYHGTTRSVAEISPSLVGLEGIGEHVDTIVIPSWGAPDFDAQLAAAVRESNARLERDGHPCGAVVLDSALTSDGIVQPQSLAATVKTIHELGAMYIADEVQSGFGRTGSAWGFERLDAIPDLVTLGKPMANGMPMSAVVGPRDVFAAFGDSHRYFNTFAGTAVSAAAAGVVLSALDSGALTERARTGGARLAAQLVDITGGSEIPARVRHNGLMLGVDFLEHGESNTARRRASFVVEELYRERVLVSTTGPCANVVKIRPPLTISDEELDNIARGFGVALQRLQDSERSHGE